MALNVVESFSFGGVDSRSNPLNFPQNRALRMKNFAPQDSGVLQLRYGFSTVTMSTVSAKAFHSVIPISLFDDSGTETDYVILGQGTGTFKVMNIATGVVTTPAMRGNPFSVANKCQSYHANNREHIGNGTDQKFFDGTTYRNNGIRSLTTAEVANVVILAGVQELGTTSRTSISLSTGTGGFFSTTSLGGMLFYISCFDTLGQELGPAPDFVGSGRVSISGTSVAVNFSSLPSINSQQVKLFSRTIDGGSDAHFCTDPSTHGTLTRSGFTVTVVSPSHGFSTGNVVMLSGATDTKYNKPWSITVIDANTFSFTIFSGATAFAASDSATISHIFSAAASATTATVAGTNIDTSFVVNQDWGVAGAQQSLANPGYQFYASLYNPITGHAGNRIAIGGRLNPLDGNGSPIASNVKINNLPDLSGEDSEWVMIIGRTGDGGEVPYVVADNSGNWLTIDSHKFVTAAANQYFNVTDAAIDGTKQMPTRNGVIPAGLDMFAKVNDRIHGAQTGKPYVNLSGIQVDSTDPDALGRGEQSWAADDFETFPTGQGLQGMFEVEGEAFYGTRNHGAILSDVTGALLWRGPWFGAGIAGKRAWCDTPYGKFWVTGHKQLATIQSGFPVPVSDEYEAALLSKIGDANLSSVEAEHIVDVEKRIDHILIKALDSNNVPFQVIHDFRLRDERSEDGQGYESAYSAPLATDFVLTKTRDADGVERLWAGASSGQLYQLHTGANDAGTEYSADAIFILNAGPNRPSVPAFRWYGDGNAVVSVGHTLDSTVDANADTDLEVLTPQTGAAKQVSGGEHDFQYEAPNSNHPEVKHAYLRIQLTSHSADGDLDLNDPPHVPLENYGRVYLSQGLVGNQRGV